MARRPDGPDPGPSAVDLASAAVLVVALGLTHPLLELFGANAEFFVARSAARADAWTFLLLVGVAAPLLVGVVVAVATWIARPLGAAALAVFGLASMVGIVARGSAASGLDGTVAVVGVLTVATLLTGGLLLAILRWPAARNLGRFGVLVPLLSVGLFVFATPSARLLRTSLETQELSLTPVGRPYPVALLVFDELPLAALMSGPDQLDAVRFPNLARLAGDGVWYRNATTVSDRTPAATPSLLSGRYPNRPGVLPVTADFPTNVFTLLSGSHDVIGVEPVTDLCPPFVCGQAEAPSAPSGATTLLADVAVVAGHTFLPGPLTERLPAITYAWGGFTLDTSAVPEVVVEEGIGRFLAVLESDRRNDLTGMLDAWSGERPPAIIGHSMLPHRPWTLLPSGLRYGDVPTPGLDGEVWTGRDVVLDEARRRLMLQTGFVDRIVGDVVAQLEEEGVYDDALIIVTSDHGLAIAPGADARTARPETLGDIAAVPLIVRYPDGPRGDVDLRPVETVDIVPTIIDVLDIEASGHLDGRSLLDASPREEQRTFWGTAGVLRYLPQQADPWPAARALRRTVGTTWEDVFGRGPFPDLVGSRVADLPVPAAVRHHATVADLAGYDDVRPGPERPQAVVEARVEGPMIAAGGAAVAIAVDGRVVRVVPTFDRSGSSAAVQAVLPESAVEPGAHDLALFLVGSGPDGPRLHRVSLADAA